MQLQAFFNVGIVPDQRVPQDNSQAYVWLATSMVADEWPKRHRRQQNRDFCTHISDRAALTVTATSAAAGKGLSDQDCTLRIVSRHIPEAGAVSGSSARTDLCAGGGR